MKKVQIYWSLFYKMLFISSFAFGGGYVVIPMIRRYFVEDMKLITEEQLLDMAAISQSTPGALAVNIAVLVGREIAGGAGVMIAGLAMIIPPIAILTVVSMFYTQFRDNKLVTGILKGMEAGVAATIVSYVIDMCLVIVKKKDLFFSLMVPVAFILTFFFDVSVVLVLALCVALAVLYASIKARKGSAVNG